MSPSALRRPRPARAPGQFPRLRRIGVPAALALAALALGGCGAPTFGAFRGATAQGHDEFKLWVGMFIAGLVVAVFVWLLIFWASFRYRRHGDEIPKQFNDHTALEITWTLVPFVIIAVIFYFTVVVENSVDAVAKNPTEIIHVLAYRWGWQFSYDDGAGTPQNVVIATTAEPKLLAQPALSSNYPQLVLPDDATIRIVLSSSDVIHGFYVPAFNFSRYAQPGVVNTFDFSTTTTGYFNGQCTQYCGLYHSEMLFSVHVESPAKFQQWLQAAQASQAQTSQSGAA